MRPDDGATADELVRSADRRWLEPNGEQRPSRSPSLSDREIVKLAPRSEYRRPDGSPIPSRFPLPFRAKSV
jgi:hypothetical protein